MKEEEEDKDYIKKIKHRTHEERLQKYRREQNKNKKI